MNALADRPRPIALTSGDPAGIGPDITIMSWLRRKEERVPVFALLGDERLIQSRCELLGMEAPCVAISDLGEAHKLFADALPVLSIPLPSPAEAGKPDPSMALAVQRAIERAVDLTLEGAACALVTNPIAKRLMTEAGFGFPGHTEFLGALAQKHGLDASPVMMLTGGGLRVVPVTIHIPLASVPAALTAERIVETALVAKSGLERWFGVGDPRLAITGLNPHAGEGGLMGEEERRIIEPAIAALRSRGVRASGPHPADTLFHARARRAYDAAIAMYHDQALIPVKTLAFDEGVNVTLGLPFIRTSPDHGTAFDIAGTGRARPDSLIAALRLAAEMDRMRAVRAESVSV